MRNLCPRCHSETLVLGDYKLEASGKKIRVNVKQCPKCGLVFYETD